MPHSTISNGMLEMLSSYSFACSFKNIFYITERQAWSEPAVPRGQLNANDPKPFSLDWSDDEDELVPMKIDFNSRTILFLFVVVLLKQMPRGWGGYYPYRLTGMFC